jgi:type I site-specific restriction endonuclease
VDAKRGLNGYCDFIISKKYNAVFIESPLIVLVEAKHNQDLPDASPQCIAEMYAARIFNDRNGENTPFIYGVVTNGYEWLFLRLENEQVIIDMDRHTLQNLPKLLGVWQTVIDYFSSI